MALEKGSGVFCDWTRYDVPPPLVAKDSRPCSSSNSKIADRKQRRQLVAVCLERLAAALKPVDDRQHPLHLEAHGFAPLDCQQARAAGGDDVLHDDERLTLAKRSFDEL